MGLSHFPVVVTLPVQWGEMDAYGHVNNGVYFRYFEGARLAYFEKMDLPGWVTPVGTGPIVHSTKARFRIPVTYPDSLEVGCRVDVASMGADRFTMHYAVWSTQHQALAAEGEAVVVVFDYAARAKAKVDAAIRAAIVRVEGAPA